MGKDRKANFIRLAESRTNKIIDSIGLLGNLANESHYEYTEEQVEAIFMAILDELETQKEKFVNSKQQKKKFRL